MSQCECKCGCQAAGLGLGVRCEVCRWHCCSSCGSSVTSNMPGKPLGAMGLCQECEAAAERVRAAARATVRRAHTKAAHTRMLRRRWGL